MVDVVVVYVRCRHADGCVLGVLCCVINRTVLWLVLPRCSCGGLRCVINHTVLWLILPRCSCGGRCLRIPVVYCRARPHWSLAAMILNHSLWKGDKGPFLVHASLCTRQSYTSLIQLVTSVCYVRPIRMKHVTYTIHDTRLGAGCGGGGVWRNILLTVYHISV